MYPKELGFWSGLAQNCRGVGVGIGLRVGSEESMDLWDFGNGAVLKV